MRRLRTGRPKLPWLRLPRRRPLSHPLTLWTDDRPAIAIRFWRRFDCPLAVALGAAVFFLMLPRIDFYHHPRIFLFAFVTVCTSADAYRSLFLFSWRRRFPLLGSPHG